MWPCLDSTVTFLSSISFGTDRTCDTAFSLHFFRTSRSLRPSLPRTSLFSLDSISTITAGCPSGSLKSIYTRNTITTRLPIIAAKRGLYLILNSESICLNLIIIGNSCWHQRVFSGSFFCVSTFSIAIFVSRSLFPHHLSFLKWDSFPSYRLSFALNFSWLPL